MRKEGALTLWESNQDANSLSQVHYSTERIIMKSILEEILTGMFEVIAGADPEKVADKVNSEIDADLKKVECNKGSVENTINEGGADHTDKTAAEGWPKERHLL